MPMRNAKSQQFFSFVILKTEKRPIKDLITKTSLNDIAILKLQEKESCINIGLQPKCPFGVIVEKVGYLTSN